MTKAELVSAWVAYEPLAARITDSVVVDGEKGVSTESGVAILLSESVGKWQDGDIIVFWRSGKITDLPDEFHFMQLIY